MPTVGEAVASLGFVDTPDARVCVVYNQGGGKVHATLDRVADRDVATLDDCYVATGRFLPGTIFPGYGRTAANLVDVVALPFDIDLLQFLAMENKDELYATPGAAIDRYIESLAGEVKDVFALCAIPISRLVSTGYGILALSHVRPQQGTRIAELRALNGYLVNTLNQTYGQTLADNIVKDAGTRIVRIPGSRNTKGVVARRAALLESHECFIDLDDFPAMDTERESRIYESRGELLPRERQQQIVDAMRTVWNEGSRHGMAMGLAGMLVKAGVTLDQAVEIMEGIAHDDPESSDRIRAVETTYHRATQGHSVAGFTQLSDLIPADTVRAVGTALDDLYRASQRTITFTRRDDAVDGGAGRGEARRWQAQATPPPPDCVYRGWFRDYRDVMRPCTEAPDAFHLGSALTMASVMIGRRAYVYQAGRNFPMLYTILVGETGGSKKDTAINLSRHVFLEQQGNGEWYVPFGTMYNVDTSQGLVSQLVENPVRLSINKEFARVLDQSRQEYAINLLRQLTQLWDGEPVENARANNPQRVETPTFGLLGATTPADLADTMARREILSGFANRVLFVYGAGRGVLDDPPEPDRNAVRGLFYRLKGHVDALGSVGRDFPKTRAAREYWHEVYHRMHDVHFPTEVARYMAQRVSSNTFRVALCYAVSEGSDVIEAEHLQAAYAWVDWCFRNASAHAETWGATEDARLANRITEALAANGTLTKAEINRLIGRDSGPMKLMQAIRALSDLGVIHIDGGGVVKEAPYARTHREDEDVESDADAGPLLPGE